MTNVLNSKILLILIIFFQITACGRKENPENPSLKSPDNVSLKEFIHPIDKSIFNSYGFIKGNNVRLREKPNLNANILSSFAGGERVGLIETGPVETINSMKSHWIKVQHAEILSNKGITGWVYGAFIVTENEGPNELLEQIWHNNMPTSERLKRYKYIRKNFPNASIPTANNSFIEYLDLTIDYEECKLDYESNTEKFGASSESELISDLLTNAYSNNIDNIINLGWCQVHINHNFHCYMEGYNDHPMNIDQAQQIINYIKNNSIDTINKCDGGSKKFENLCINISERWKVFYCWIMPCTGLMRTTVAVRTAF